MAHSSTGSWLQVPNVAPLPRDVKSPSTAQIATLLLAERELETQRAVIRKVRESAKTPGQGGGRGALPPLGLRTYRQGVTVQVEEDGMYSLSLVVRFLFIHHDGRRTYL